MKKLLFYFNWLCWCIHFNKKCPKILGHINYFGSLEEKHHALHLSFIDNRNKMRKSNND